ncbi:unnamed protein product [Anisakis simplex]|uniref:Uncharacterized protein n=1 Tax=Anisakis simplex TaxID=6269 RepID=A0A0M3J7W4_ANISI|nr:unnamed protein product [Anisakis simplex]
MNAADRIPAYASVDDRVSKDMSSLGAIPLRRRIDVYYRRKSMRPAYFNRTSWEQAPWITYLQTKQASKMSDESRKRKRDATNNSSIRDHSYSPLRKARRNSCSSSNRRRVSLLKHAGSRLVRRSLDYKRYGERMQRKNKVLYGNNANNNNAAYACSSTGGFGMASALNHNHQNITDVDAAMSSDYCIDGTIVGLPQKIDYKEITIPK